MNKSEFKTLVKEIVIDVIREELPALIAAEMETKLLQAFKKGSSESNAQVLTTKQPQSVKSKAPIETKKYTANEKLNEALNNTINNLPRDGYVGLDDELRMNDSAPVIDTNTNIGFLQSIVGQSATPAQESVLNHINDIPVDVAKALTKDYRSFMRKVDKTAATRKGAIPISSDFNTYED